MFIVPLIIIYYNTFMFNMSNISSDILYPLGTQFYLIPFDARHQSSEQSLNGLTSPSQFCRQLADSM